MKKIIFLCLILSAAFVSRAQFDIVFPYDQNIPVIDSCKILNYTESGFVSYKLGGINNQIIAIKAIQNGFLRTFPKVELTVLNNASFRSQLNRPVVSMLKDTLRKEAEVKMMDSTFYNFITDELVYENERYEQIKHQLKSVRTTKTIGIVITSGGALLTTIGLLNDYKNMYIGGGIASAIGILVWISAPTKPLSYECQMTIKRIKHLENMRTKYDVSINLLQPRDVAGIGISLNF